MAHGQGGGIKDDQEGPGGWMKRLCACCWDKLIRLQGRMFHGLVAWCCVTC